MLKEAVLSPVPLPRPHYCVLCVDAVAVSVTVSVLTTVCYVCMLWLFAGTRLPLKALPPSSLLPTVSVAARRHKKTLEGHSKGVRSLAYSPGSRFLFSAGFDYDALVWNPYVEQACVCEADIAGRFHTSTALFIQLLSSS